MGNSVSGENFDPVSNKETERGECESMGIRYAVSEMMGLRPTMEDQHIHQIGIRLGGVKDTAEKDAAEGEQPEVQQAAELENHAIFGVFDGHGGEFTSKYLADHFLDVFSQRPELVQYSNLPKEGSRGQSDVNAVVLLQKALTKTFLQLDEKLLPLHKERTAAILSGKMSPTPLTQDDTASPGSVASALLNARATKLGERSGSTAVVVLLTPSHLICANTGDSRAVLRRNGRALPLSMDHKPTELPERVRIFNSGGFVKGRRVNGDLAVSRAFGDFAYKKNRLTPQQLQQRHQERQLQRLDSGHQSSTPSSKSPANRQQVTVSPDVMVYPRDSEGDEFIILACDGIWDVASNDQVSDFVQTLLSEGEGDLGNVCEEILDTCLDRNSRDNMTIMLVGLPGLEIDNAAEDGSSMFWGQSRSVAAHRRQRGIGAEVESVMSNIVDSVGGMVAGDRRGSNLMV